MLRLQNGGNLDIAIKTIDLTKRYGNVLAVDYINFEVKEERNFSAF